MPNLASIVSRFIDTKCLYFAKKTGGDGFGKVTYEAPVEIDVRWEETQQEIVLPDGRTVLSRGYLLLSTELVAGGKVWRGTKAQWVSKFAPDPPTQAEGGQEIIYVKKTPGIRQLPGNVYEAYY